MSLPSGYTAMVGIRLTSYFNTGILPSSDLEIEYLFNRGGLGAGSTGYLFGSRRTNSNTSDSQYNLYMGSPYYFGYGGARVSLGSNPQFVANYVSHFYGFENSMQMNTYVTMTTGQGNASATFNTTRPIWLGGLNNAGSLSGQFVHTMYGMKISQSGSVVRDYIPCYDTTNSTIGLYDNITEQFYNLSTPTGLSNAYLVSVNDNTGGEGFAKMLRGDFVKEIYGGSTTYWGFGGVTLVAKAEDGYEFVNWTDGNGNIVSTEPEFQHTPTADITFTPNFQKVTDVAINTNYQLKIYQYGQSGGSRPTVLVQSATVKTDTLQKTTSTFVLKEVPSIITKGSYVSLFSPRGKQMYFGVVESIDENTITCREMLSVFDQDYVFSPSLIPNTDYTVMQILETLIAKAEASNFDPINNADFLLLRKLSSIYNVNPDNQGLFNFKVRFLTLDHNKNPNFNIPAISSTETKNFEEYLLQIFNDFGIYVDIKEYNASRIQLSPYYYKADDTIDVSNNSEAITDVNVLLEDQEANVVMVYNSSGTTVRGKYGVKTDGTIVEATAGIYNQLIAYSDYKAKVVMSDDNIITILSQNLTNAQLNHKITFNVRFGGMFKQEDFYIGRPINFYIGDKLYQSVITSVEFNIVENREMIDGAKITIGKVRTNLTSKLNLGKVK